jgi:hypothetical protein
MSLSTPQTISLYQIMGIPYSATYSVHDGMGTGDDYSNILATYATIKTEVDAFLAGLTSDVETAIKSLVAEWDDVSLKSNRMDAGGVTGINGVTIDYDRKRELIQQRMENLVPFISRWRHAVRTSATGPNTMSLTMWS